MFVESGDRFSFFLPPYVVFGRGTRSAISEYAKRLGMTRALLVVDPFFVETDYFAEIREGLEGVGIKVISWSGVVPDPTDVSVDDAVKVYKDANCDGAICIGGGSAVDTGKSVAVVIGSGSQGIREHTAPTDRPVEGMAPVICLPTTAGTGAEVNPYAMVTNTETGRKGVAYPALGLLAAQRVAIVDPDLTASMPPRLTAITAMDALCQALECYITRTPNPVSDCLALCAINLIAGNLRPVVDNGRDMKARVNMSLAAMLATMAFPNAGLSYPHYLSEPMADAYHLEHGVAVGSVLVATLEVLLPFRTDRLAEVAKVFGVPSEGRSQREMAEAGIREIQQLMKDIEFPTLSEATGGAGVVDVDALLEDLVDRKPHLVGGPTDQMRVRRIMMRSLEF
jgi:alcohol dehydrogenase class IV